MSEAASTTPQRRDGEGSEGELSPEMSNAARQPPESRMNKIARRAHEIYEARGGEQGKALEDWLQAEREIDAELSAQPGIKR
jgi:hypothetical protein